MTIRTTIERWLADGESFVGVFENLDFGSADLGKRIGLCFDLADWDRLKLGDRAPDTPKLIGWRYLCIGKARTLDEALAFFRDDSIPTDTRGVDTPSRID